MAIKNISHTYSAELEGINARIIEVEIDLNIGIHSFNIVGLADKALKTIDNTLLSPRGYYRLLKVARTIADLDGETFVTEAHLAKAFSYRLRNET